MADNVIANPGAGGVTFRTDDDGIAHWPYSKLAWGADNTQTIVAAGAGAIPIQDGGNSITVDGTVAVSGTVTVDNSAVTQPVSNAGLTELAAAINASSQMDVNIAASNATVTVDLGVNNDVTVTGTVVVDLGVNNDVTVTGAVAVTQSGVWDEVGINDSGNSITVDNAQLSVVGGGVELTALRVTIASDSTGVLSIDDNAGSITVDGTITANLAAGTNNIGDVDVLSLPSLPSGINNIGDVDVLSLPALPAGTNNIGDVDVLTLPALVAGTANIGDVDVLTIAAGDNNIGNVDIVTMPNVTLAAGTNTNEVVGDAAHDAAAAGNPVLVAGVAQDSDDTAPPNRVSAEGDVARLATDRDGSLHVLPFGPQIWSYHVNGSSALTDTSVHTAPGAGLSIYIGSIVFSSGAATAINMLLEEGTTTTICGPYYLEAVAGRGMAIQFNPPKKMTVNTALNITTSAAIAHSVDITGYIAQG